MYQATIDGVHLCSTNSVGGFDCISDPVAKLIVNGADSFDFVLYPQHPVYPDVVCKVSRVKIWQGNKLIFYGTVTGYSETMDGVRTYSCEGALAWLNELCVPSYHLSGATPEQALSWYISSYNRTVRDPSKKFSVGTVTVQKAKRKDGTEGTISRSSGVHPSYWEEISQKLLDSFGGILRIRYSGTDDCAGVIDWLAIPDATCDQDIRYAKNLMNCDWTYDATPIVTAVVPLGKKKDGSSEEDDEFRVDILKSNDTSMTALLAQLVGDDYVKSGDMVYSKSRVEKYGLIQQTVTFDDESAPDTIAYLGAVWLKQNGMASSTVSAEAIDIADIDESVSHFVCGDYVRTQLPGYEEEQLFPVTSIEIPLAAPEDARLTVGTQESGIASGGTTTGGGSISDVGSGSDAMAHTHANKGVLDKITEQDYTDFKSAVARAHTHDNKDTLDKLTPSAWAELMAAKNKAHTHSNKDTLDKIDETSWTRVYGMSHEHDNKDVLDQITQEEWKSINSAKNKAHTHDNKETLDKIDEVSWLTVYGQTHEHSNKDVLDKITASYTTEEKTKLKGIADGAEVNQNAFSSIATGSSKYTASTKQASFLVEGNGGTTVTLDPKTGRLTVESHQHSNQNILDQLNEEQWKIINGAANKAHVHDNKDTLDKITDALWNTVYSNTHTHDNKSVLDNTTASYTTAEKTKLAGIADGANKYTHPTTSGNKHIPSGGSSGQILRWSSDGTAVWDADNNTTYSDATQSAHGLMSVADKKKLDGMDLSKYLPLAGGVMTGDIDMQTNKRDILVGTQPASTYGTFTPPSSGHLTGDKVFTDLLPTMRSYIGTYNYKIASRDEWYEVISVRHRNGYGDGSNWGMLIFAPLFGGNLQWNLNTNKGVWQGYRTILDSENYTSYAADKNHTHAVITNSVMDLGSSGGAVKWIKLGTIVSAADGRTMVIRVWSGDGFNARTDQNASFEIHIKDSWQSTASATNACAVTVYRINCPNTVTVKVIPTDAVTYTVWIHPSPWTYWNGNYAIYGYYRSWTRQYLTQDAEPTGTGAAIAYYDQAFLTSTVAAAKTLTDSGWQVPTFPSGISQSSIRYRKQGKIVSVTGYVKFSASTAAKTVLTLPEEYRPPKKIQQFNAVDSSSQASFLTVIDTDGSVRFSGKTQGFFDTTSEYYIHCTFFVD